MIDCRPASFNNLISCWESYPLCSIHKFLQVQVPRRRHAFAEPTSHLECTKWLVHNMSRPTSRSCKISNHLMYDSMYMTDWATMMQSWCSAQVASHQFLSVERWGTLLRSNCRAYPGHTNEQVPEKIFPFLGPPWRWKMIYHIPHIPTCDHWWW